MSSSNAFNNVVKLRFSDSVRDLPSSGDKTTQFQAAIDALPSGGGTIIIPYGSHTVTPASLTVAATKAVVWQLSPGASVTDGLPGTVMSVRYGANTIVEGESARNGRTYLDIRPTTGLLPNHQYDRAINVTGYLDDDPSSDVDRDLIAYGFRLGTDHHGPLGGEIRGIKGIVYANGGQANLRAAHVLAEGTDGHTGDLTGILSEAMHFELAAGVAAIGKSAAYIGQVGAGVASVYEARCRPEVGTGTRQTVNYVFRQQEGSLGVDARTASFQAHNNPIAGGDMFRGVDFATSTALWRVKPTGVTLAPGFYSGRATLADDTVTTVTPPQTTGFMAVYAETASAEWAIRFFRVGASPATAAIAAGASFASGTAVLTNGTGDGTDLMLNVNFASDGLVYIKNRSGASRNITWFFICQ